MRERIGEGKNENKRSSSPQLLTTYKVICVLFCGNKTPREMLFCPFQVLYILGLRGEVNLACVRRHSIRELQISSDPSLSSNVHSMSRTQACCISTPLKVYLPRLRINSRHHLQEHNSSFFQMGGVQT